MKTMMKRVIAGAGTAALLGGSLMLGAGAANAATCAAGEHYVDLGTMGGYCAPDASGGGTGGSTGSYLGGSQAAPVQQAPVQQGPTLSGVPQYGNVPAAPAPAPAPVRQAPAAPSGGYSAPAGGGYSYGYSAPSRAGGYTPQNYGGTVSSGVRQNPGSTYVAPSGATLEQNDQGAWVDASTGQAAPADEAAAATQAAQAPADDAAAQQAAQAKAAADAKAAQEKKDAEVKAAVAQAQMTQSVKDAVAQAWAGR